jgi:hypothetical protein
MAAHRVDQRGALADQQLARRLHHGGSLGLGILDRHEAHAGTAGRLADRLGIGAIILAALEKRFDVLWRDQPHDVAKPGQLASPMM